MLVSYHFITFMTENNNKLPALLRGAPPHFVRHASEHLIQALLHEHIYVAQLASEPGIIPYAHFFEWM